MDGIVKKNEFCGGVKNGDGTVQRLLFADDLAPLESIQNSLRQALIRFWNACSVAGMKISTGTMKTETMCQSRQLKQCFLYVGGVPLKQSEKFEYLGISFTSDGRQNSELSMRERESLFSYRKAQRVIQNETKNDKCIKKIAQCLSGERLQKDP